MSDEAGPYTGSIPQAYRNAIFWRWAPDMPRGLPAAFVTLLYAVGTSGDAAGRLQFRDGHPIRVKDIASAIRADIKDVRRYLNAAVIAGVLTIEGGRERGKSTLYVLVISPRPDWDAAAAFLAGSRRKRTHAPPWLEAKVGGVSPQPPADGKGGHTPQEKGGHTPHLSHSSADEGGGIHPPPGWGDTPPLGWGDTPPNNPWETQGVSQEIADVGDQPPPVREQPRQDQISSQEKTPFARCRECGNPLVTLPGQAQRTICRTCEQSNAELEADRG